ncbi:MAG: ribonuclease Y [bacterium]
MDLIIISVAALAAGIVAGYYVRKNFASHQLNSVEAKAKKILEDAKTQEKEQLFQAKSKALSLIEEAKKEESLRRKELDYLQKRLEKRESLFDQKLLELQEKQQKLFEKANKIEEIKEEIQKIKDNQMEKLEKIAGLSKDKAREALFNNTEEEMKEALISRIRKLEKESSEVVEREAKKVLSLVIQRCAGNYVTETTTSTVVLPSDEMKGRVIGREGRNIKSIEQLTGTEIIVDDTPNAITISGFSGIRRQIAKKTLEKLILDGRIHPTKIEEAIEESKKELACDIRKSGEETLYDLGIAGIDPKLAQILGRLKYRTSYGQNVLQHSIEVAHLSALLAGELKANVSLAKKAGLFHDIGKAVDHEVQGTHPEIGRDIGKKFNLPDDVITPILTHHDDNPPTLEALIVKVADAISSSRMGARKDSLENYIHRLEELEKVAVSFDGVEKAYAIQAGREVRVFVVPNQIDDLEAHHLALNIAKQIEKELKYPGEIRVNVIRELRVTEYAR